MTPTTRTAAIAEAPAGSGGARDGDAAAMTPTLRAAGRRARFWIVAGLGAVTVSLAAALVTAGGRAVGPDLGADNPAPGGGMAVVEVLRGQGVDVVAADTLAEARSAISGADDPTLFIYDESGYLTRDVLASVVALAPRVVVAGPADAAVDTLVPGARTGGIPDDRGPIPARCDVTAAVRAGALSPDGSSLSLPADGSGRSIGCFPTGEDTYLVVERTEEDRTITLVAPTAVFRNGTVTDAGNAALALNLLGSGDSLVWYLPTIDDVPRTGPPSIAELTPGWVTPALVLLLICALSAAVWRGRRFGPLVPENLPVTVKAGETMEGRARLYARSSARLRAIDALRLGAIQRLASLTGLSRTASLDEVVLAVSALTGQDRGYVRGVLVDVVPGSDSSLVALSDQLRDLERATAQASTGHAHERMDE